MLSVHHTLVFGLSGFIVCYLRMTLEFIEATDIVKRVSMTFKLFVVFIPFDEHLHNIVRYIKLCRFQRLKAHRHFGCRH